MHSQIFSIIYSSEAKHAFKCEKNIILLRYEEDFEIEDWLDIIIDDGVYIDVQTEQSLKDNMPGILKRLQDMEVPRWGKTFRKLLFYYKFSINVGKNKFYFVFLKAKWI